MTPEDCPKFRHCSAPICPLDPHWRVRRHRNKEPVCFYLLEYVKPGIHEALRRTIPTELFEAVEVAHPEIIDRYGPIKRRLERASKTESRLGRRPGPRRHNANGAYPNTEYRPDVRVPRGSGPRLPRVSLDTYKPFEGTRHG